MRYACIPNPSMKDRAFETGGTALKRGEIKNRKNREGFAGRVREEKKDTRL